MVAQRELVSAAPDLTMGLATRVLFLPVMGAITEELLCEVLWRVARGLTRLGVCCAITPAEARGVTMRHPWAIR